jgi:hypothetical protein
VSKSNYPNIAFVINKTNQTQFDVFLPPVSGGAVKLFDAKITPVLIIDVLCFNSFIVTHRRTIDFKICRVVNPIRDIVLANNVSEDNITLTFDMPVDTFIAKLLPVDTGLTGKANYEFMLTQPNEYLTVGAYFAALSYIKRVLNHDKSLFVLS